MVSCKHIPTLLNKIYGSLSFVLIVGDSIIKNMSLFEGVVIRSFSGATIVFSFLRRTYQFKHHNLSDCSCNNIIERREKPGAIMSDYGSLIDQIKKINPY